MSPTNCVYRTKACLTVSEARPLIELLLAKHRVPAMYKRFRVADDRPMRAHRAGRRSEVPAWRLRCELAGFDRPRPIDWSLDGVRASLLQLARELPPGVLLGSVRARDYTYGRPDLADPHTVARVAKANGTTAVALRAQALDEVRLERLATGEPHEPLPTFSAADAVVVLRQVYRELPVELGLRSPAVRLKLKELAVASETRIERAAIRDGTTFMDLAERAIAELDAERRAAGQPTRAEQIRINLIEDVLGRLVELAEALPPGAGLASREAQKLNRSKRGLIRFSTACTIARREGVEPAWLREEALRRHRGQPARPVEPRR